MSPHLLLLEINEMTVVSEPELAVQILHRLRALECDVAQGFYFARPMPAPELGAWVTSSVTGLRAQQSGVSQPIA